MGKSKSVAPEQRRCSPRLASLQKPKAVLEVKKKAIKKGPPKAKKAKPAENGNTKTEEPKADAAEAN